MKTITICDKEYPIDCNALTYVQYRKVFNRGIFEDIEIIERFIIEQTLSAKELKENSPQMSNDNITKELSRIMLHSIDKYIEAVTRLAYICIFSADEKIVSYEEWLKEIKRINTNDEWIVEVTKFVVDCFC